MAFEATVLKILIGSPGDTKVERDALEQEIRSWNSANGEARRIFFITWRWELDAIPKLGAPAQQLINQPADKINASDFVIAIFNHRLGSPTEDFESGTVEEIMRAYTNQKAVHVWFSSADIPQPVNLEQLGALARFKDKISKLGLYKEFETTADLVSQVRHTLDDEVNDLLAGAEITTSNAARAVQTEREDELAAQRRAHNVVREHILPSDPRFVGESMFRVTNASGSPIFNVGIVSGHDIFADHSDSDPLYWWNRNEVEPTFTPLLKDGDDFTVAGQWVRLRTGVPETPAKEINARLVPELRWRDIDERIWSTDNPSAQPELEGQLLGTP